ncbi:MAG TPA: MerR family transcriptional regulator [Rhizobiales bacterium]|nr:MerR family transcriptional regulator [Hyphomicrobiales bacterium]
MSGEILSEDRKLALKDICEHCGLPESKVRAYIQEGVVEVRGDDIARWRFSEVSVVQIQKAHRLEQDLRLNPAGAALALELMSQIEDLKNQLKRLQRTPR